VPLLKPSFSRGINSVTKLNIKGVAKPAPQLEIIRPKSIISKLLLNKHNKEPIKKLPLANKKIALAVKRLFKYEDEIIKIAIANK